MTGYTFNYMKVVNRNFLLGIFAGVFLAALFVSGAMVDRIWGIPGIDRVAGLVGVSVPVKTNDGENNSITRNILNEESYVIDVAERASPAVVTVGIKKNQQILRNDPFFDPFGFFRQQPSIGTQKIEKDIGSGFVVASDGLVVTNKHVVSDVSAGYVVITKDGKEYEVEKIDRDPLNDLAILKINANDMATVAMGDSDALRVGQSVVAIGTALGEFRHTVTTGVISGLGRGIMAGGGYNQMSEELDNVIQTDAAINPGNSGGPLLNSLGQVIGVNVAVAQGSENIGFALPVNLIKDALDSFENRGGFGNRAYLGVRYYMISEKSAIVNEVPQGAYLEDVVEGSAANVAGLESGDILVKFDGKTVKDVKGGLAVLINEKKAGDKVKIEYWRDGETKSVDVELKAGE